ncbi:hypothetical protein ElyMa_006999900 [Elysia marginata]|uniref:Uncharacterized protein n=1 Tax=Elysia marginata TaxID=1093978 RepID=A0AAV4JPP9_9GAST|nr:hypothetical protein ElyMa_006999900 [Elysia marginata]
MMMVVTIIITTFTGNRAFKTKHKLKTQTRHHWTPTSPAGSTASRATTDCVYIYVRTLENPLGDEDDDNHCGDNTGNSDGNSVDDNNDGDDDADPLGDEKDDDDDPLDDEGDDDNGDDDYDNDDDDEE